MVGVEVLQSRREVVVVEGAEAGVAHQSRPMVVVVVVAAEEEEEEEQLLRNESVVVEEVEELRLSGLVAAAAEEDRREVVQEVVLKVALVSYERVLAEGLNGQVEGVVYRAEGEVVRVMQVVVWRTLSLDWRARLPDVFSAPVAEVASSSLLHCRSHREQHHRHSKSSAHRG